MKTFDWKAIATTRFKPKRTGASFLKGSCGTYALHCLTGVSLKTIEKECPKKGWWDDAAMRKFLKKRGYTTIPITQKLIQSSKPYRYRYNINHQHILLISTHSSEAEGTWEVVYNNKVYHGHEVEFFNGYELLVNPLWTAYFIWHPKWTTSEKAKKKDCEQYWISHKGSDGFAYHPQTGGWFNLSKKKIGTPP